MDSPGTGRVLNQHQQCGCTEFGRSKDVSISVDRSVRLLSERLTDGAMVLQFQVYQTVKLHGLSGVRPVRLSKHHDHPGLIHDVWKRIIHDGRMDSYTNSIYVQTHVLDIECFVILIVG